MADFYAGLAATATRLLTEYGVAAVVRATPITATDPSAGTVTTGTPVNTDCVAMRTSWDEEYFEGALVEDTNRFFILDVQPNIEDELVLDSEVMTIQKVKVIKPADTFLIAFVMV